ncbi:MAG: divalent-cation tolerance protein CutA [Methanoregula sp.]|nr:divalent-cation tolerance protein CutA [Methanoregula sp.]
METKRDLERTPEICIILSTVPPAKSAEIAWSLIDRHLVACVNMVPVRSWYSWKGEFCDDEEHLLIAKTRKEMAGTVIREIRALHPYEIPEIIELPVNGGHLPYLEWVLQETREP